MYTLKYTALFEKKVKEFRKDKELIEELKKIIENLLSDPLIGKPLQYELTGRRSIRIKGKYRLIYKLNENNNELILEAFGHRKNIYNIAVLFKRKGK